MAAKYRFKKKTVQVALYDRKEPIPALCLDEFAIHGTLNADGIPSKYGFTVTHIFTGYSLAKFWKRSRARSLVEDLVTLGLNWQFENADDIPDGVWAQAKPVIQKYTSNPDY